jgi:K+-transporting ATPase ATPase C chain
MLRVLFQSFRAVIVLTVLTGVLYPLAVTAVARLPFKERALGSRISVGGKLAGSALIGQPFSKPEYLWGRPSAAGSGYDATSSGGTNQSPVGGDAIARVVSERLRLKAANPDAPGEPPLLLVTASGSGLDPHISPEAARWQVPRIAKARGVAADRIARLLDDANLGLIEGRTLGVLGEPRVNVLLFNIELDKQFPLAR